MSIYYKPHKDSIGPWIGDDLVIAIDEFKSRFWGEDKYLRTLHARGSFNGWHWMHNGCWVGLYLEPLLHPLYRKAKWEREDRERKFLEEQARKGYGEDV